MIENKTLFFSYSRNDADFALRLAKDMRDAGCVLWLDQLDIPVGSQWDKSVEAALRSCESLLLIISKSSIASDNVNDEVSFAIEEGKRIIPILKEECELPLRWRRFQNLDFTSEYDEALRDLLVRLQAKQSNKMESNSADAKTDINKGNDGSKWKPWYLGISIAVSLMVIFGAYYYLNQSQDQIDPPKNQDKNTSVTPEKKKPVSKLEKLKTPLHSISGVDLDLSVRISLIAPLGTKVGLDIYRGSEKVTEIYGSVDTDENSWVPGLKIVRSVAALPRIPGDTHIRGQLIMPNGRVIPVDIKEPGDLEDGYDFDVQINKDGKVEFIQAVACPWVYTLRDGQWVQTVEIIRNLNGKEKETSQQVHLGLIKVESSGEVRLQIREILPEISYLDSIELVVPWSKTPIRPVKASRDLDSLLRVDSKYAVMKQNEKIELLFRDSIFEAGKQYELIIIASGYYISTEK